MSILPAQCVTYDLYGHLFDALPSPTRMER